MHSTQQSHQKPSASRRYSRAPSGLLLPLHATLKGRVRWQVLDERGVPEVPRTPSGIPVGPVKGVEQPNLITNLGMDNITINDVFGIQVSITGGWRGWRERLAVGTGSVAPDVTDTALDNQVQFANSSGPFGNGAVEVSELDTVTNEWVAAVNVNRIVTMTDDRNLTEFSLGRDTDVHIRELFRDSGGTPITVSLLNGKTILMTHTAEVRIPAPAAAHSTTINVEEYDAGNTLQATIPYDIRYGLTLNGENTLVSTNTNPGTSSTWIGAQVWNPVRTAGRLLVLDSTDIHSYDRLRSIANPTTYTTEAVTSPSLVAYTPGSYERVKRYAVPVSTVDGVRHGFMIAALNGTSWWLRGYWTVLFDDPATYTLAGTDELVFSVRSTWARA